LAGFEIGKGWDITHKICPQARFKDGDHMNDDDE